MTQSKSKGITFILCLFFGAAGIHRMYVGKLGSGVAQLLLTMTFFGVLISAPWALIDAIMILAGRFNDSDGNQLR